MVNRAGSNRLRRGRDRDAGRRLWASDAALDHRRYLDGWNFRRRDRDRLALGVGTVSYDAFNGMIVLDELRLGFTLIFLLVSFLTLLIANVWVDGEQLPAGEFHSLLLFATVGMMLMASGNDLVIVFWDSRFCRSQLT